MRFDGFHEPFNVRHVGGRILAPAHEQAGAMGFGTQKFLRSGFLDACSIGCRDNHGHLQMHFAYKAPAVSRWTGHVTSQ